MSRNIKSTPFTKPKTTDSKKPYCKVCFDAGKPESEYTSHWVRSLPDRNGNTTVTCPTLLDTECRYCYKFGHTTKFCPAIKQHEKEREHSDRNAKAAASEQKKPKVQEKKSGSVFAALIDSESEDEKPVKVSKPVENFPVLSTPVNVEKPKQEVKTGWAAIVAKPVEVKHQPEPAKCTNGLVLMSEYLKKNKIEENKVVETKAEQLSSKKEPVVTKSWADWSDSEDDDEDEAYEPDTHYAFDDEEEIDETW